jgi:ElaB/YqjD/DUF883 family membrane-anchored ribosome-binding protein
MRDAYHHQVAQKEIRQVVSSSEALLEALGDEGGAAVDELRERLTNTIAALRQHLDRSMLSNIRDTIATIRETAASANDFVRRRPWTAVAIGTVAGLLIGSVACSRGAPRDGD